MSKVFLDPASLSPAQQDKLPDGWPYQFSGSQEAASPRIEGTLDARIRRETATRILCADLEDGGGLSTLGVEKAVQVADALLAALQKPPAV